MDDFKSRGQFLKKMLKMFDENTEDLMSKMSSFRDGDNDDEESESAEDDITNALL